MSNTLLVILCKPDRFSAKLQHVFATDIEGNRCDQYPYHGAFVVRDSKYGEPMMYDMSWRSRRVAWSEYAASRPWFAFDLPVEIPEAALDATVGKILYGAVDVAMYPILQPLGINFMGVHCTEYCNDMMQLYGIRTPWDIWGAPPTPCALLSWGLKAFPYEAFTPQ